MSDRADNVDSSRYLNFSLCEEQYAIPLLQVKEVIGNLQTTPIPNAPTYFKGLINLRGQVISVLDLRQKLKLPKSETGLETTIIILDLEQSQIGVIVDSVDCVLNFAPEDIEAAGNLDTFSNSQFLEGVAKKDKKLILLLDIAKTLTEKDIQVARPPAGHKKSA